MENGYRMMHFLWILSIWCIGGIGLASSQRPTIGLVTIHPPTLTTTSTTTLTKTVTGPCTSLASGVHIKYWNGTDYWKEHGDKQRKGKVALKAAGGNEEWVEINNEDLYHNVVAEELQRRKKELESEHLPEEIDPDRTVLVRARAQATAVTTITVTATVSGRACPFDSGPTAISQVLNCPTTSSSHGVLIFDDAVPDKTSPDDPILTPAPPSTSSLPAPPGAWDYRYMRFSPGFLLFHCEANHLPLTDPRGKVCDSGTLEGFFYLALYSPTNTTVSAAGIPVKRSITFPTGRSFDLNSIDLSALPVPQGGDIGGSRGVVTVIIKGYTSSAVTARPSFIDVKYIRRKADGSANETLQRINYGLSFFDLVRLEFAAVEGVWIVGDAEDWTAVDRRTGKHKWEGKGAEIWMDNIGLCRYF